MQDVQHRTQMWKRECQMPNASVKMEAGLTSVEVSSLWRPAETGCATTTTTTTSTASTAPTPLRWGASLWLLLLLLPPSLLPILYFVILFMD